LRHGRHGSRDGAFRIDQACKIKRARARKVSGDEFGERVYLGVRQVVRGLDDDEAGLAEVMRLT
jgi:hypothetical protein